MFLCILGCLAIDKISDKLNFKIPNNSKLWQIFCSFRGDVPFLLGKSSSSNWNDWIGSRFWCSGKLLVILAQYLPHCTCSGCPGALAEVEVAEQRPHIFANVGICQLWEFWFARE